MNARIALVVALFACGCTDDPIVLATIPPAEDGGSHLPTSCVSKSDCPAGSYCDRKDCRPNGICLSFPAICDDDEKEVCGGETGVTYFNDCLRRAAGEACAEEGECVGGAFCDGPEKIACADYATCAHLGGVGPDACGPDVRGTCWVLPATCPPPTMPDRWNDCVGTDSPCVDTCAAVRSGHPFRRAVHCE